MYFRQVQIFILLFLICGYFFFHINFNKSFKVCICTIGKKENLYVREYVKYYRDKGINKIFIYDNNDKNDENFEVVLTDYISIGFVEIIDYRGMVASQLKAMDDCRKNNFKKFDWLIFFDMDEFLFLRNFPNINDFLKQKIFHKCQRIQLNWFVHTDNNLLYYDNRTLFERFPEKYKKWEGMKIGGTDVIKSILRGGIDVKITDNHILNSDLISCDGFGNIKTILNIKTNESDHYYNYIDHFWSKSTEEFVNKLMKGDAILGYKNIENNMRRINMYFRINEITPERINYIENRTQYNLTKFRLMIKNYSNI